MTTPSEVDPLDQAAHSFKTAINIIKNKNRTLPRKSLERVFNAIVEFPLADKEPSFRNKTEHDLFILTINALQCKNTMITAVMSGYRDAEQKLNEAQEKVINEPNRSEES